MKKNIRKTNIPSDLLLFVLVSLIIAANILFGIFSGNDRFTFDVSSSGIYTLSESTSKILSGLTGRVEIYKFSSYGSESSIIDTLLGRYTAASRNITIKTLSYDTSSNFYRDFETEDQHITENSLIFTDAQQKRYKVLSLSDLFSYNNSYEPVAVNAEAKITSAINYIDTGLSARACFLTGHKETAFSALSALRRSFENMNYETLTYLAASSQALSPSSDILVIVSPKNDLSKEEMENIRIFLYEGGRAMFFMDNASFQNNRGVFTLYPDELPNFYTLFSAYGLRLNKDIVIGGDTSHTGLRPATLRVELQNNTFTSSLIKQNQNVVLSDTSSLSVIGSTSSSITSIVLSPESCYNKSIADFKDFKRGNDDASQQFLLGAYSENGQGSIFLFGTSSLVTGDGMNVEGNRHLISSLITYAGNNTSNLNIPEKSMAFAGETRGFSLAFISVAMLPILFVLTGAMIILRRRRR